ncbi:MAG: FAD-dependent oxidoreductase [Sedimentisphaerales bacterium]|jgi:heterodisulfide reductase subunit A
MQKTKTVLVIGAGIAGATTAHRLNQAGLQVHLIEKAATIGGRVREMGCKATDVCLRCNVCVANELFRTVAASPDIHIQTRTQLCKLKTGTNGSRYTAILTHQPNFIDHSKCTGCQACIAVCPEKCIVSPKPALSPAVPVIDYSLCRRASGKECLLCEQACPLEAINMQDKSSESKLDVDSVVIATGYEPYNPAENTSYGYGISENIITGTEAEHQLATTGEITRPSDGQTPKRIAFIQCVGSRTEEVYRRPEDTDYCSTVCCAYALRMAKQIKYQNEDAEVTVFYMDIQNFGKGFDDFYNKCKDNMTFVRSRPYEVKQGPNDTLRLRFAPQSLPQGSDSQVCEQDFDLVVLAVGIRPRPDTTELAEKLLVPLDEQGFFGFKNASPLPALQREGIFVAGACESPKDIKSCMAQAEAVSAAVIGEA